MHCNHIGTLTLFQCTNLILVPNTGGRANGCRSQRLRGRHTALDLCLQLGKQIGTCAGAIVSVLLKISVTQLRKILNDLPRHIDEIHPTDPLRFNKSVS